ncbi:hypothetical protein GH714_035234 [Hevea brasiliensis]|uniref:Uncharacterized protein n=1 Tax=Hevea brasiliensis TaxID=3981 RepID=A0A6A6KK90_HEVBR|nr:hypothetical protein GH714_035234 [Hevea brasiliensis]
MRVSRDWFSGFGLDLDTVSENAGTSVGLEQTLPWIFYHIVIGLSSFFLFVEGKAASPNVSKVLGTIPVSSVEQDDVKEPFIEVSMFKKNYDLLPKDVYFGNYKEATHVGWNLSEMFSSVDLYATQSLKAISAKGALSAACQCSFGSDHSLDHGCVIECPWGPSWQLDFLEEFSIGIIGYVDFGI